MLILGPNSPCRTRSPERFSGDGAGAGVGEAFRERLVEVVRHLTFKLQPLVGLEAGARTDAAEIIVGLRKPQIVGEHTNLHMLIVVLSKS